MRKPVTLHIFFVVMLCITSLSFARTQCSPTGEDSNEHIFFFNHDLGFYNVHLFYTLAAIRNHSAGPDLPYYRKPWLGPIPNLCDQGGCIEFTVYPDLQNFTNVKNPNIDIMNEIKKYTHGRPNRGEVRIITDATMTKYIYTTDHEVTFCPDVFGDKSAQPYSL